ncbi:FAD-binding oxidoreductase [Microlunatus sp. GCM10028923]|uniref:FAD-binding oxidoreductase n=1 Tax=Microlunatus sp. GCM10028923 TaxID=3273400 RepID=UPI003606B54B
MSTTLELLGRDFGGDIIDSSSDQYPAASRTPLALGSPAMVLRPVTVADVRAAVRFAAASGLPLSVRGGGHAFAGFGTNDGGVVIDLGRLAGVEVIDEDRHLVRIGGGATWGQVADALAPHGLAISSGDTRSVGVGGLTLGGGMGWKVRKYGLALDSLVAAELITADGELVRADADDHADLFWAIRGGGGNFGIVTAFEFAAHPTTDVHFGKITFPRDQATQVLLGWADLIRDAAPELTAIADLANPAAGGPEAPVQVHVAVDTDDPDLAARTLEPLRRLAPVIDDDVTLRPYGDLLVEGQVLPPGLQLIPRNAFVDRDSVPQALSILAEVGTSGRSPFIALRSLGGAVSRVAGEATAYPYRQAELMITTIVAGPPPVIEAAGPGVAALWERLDPYVYGAYANFLGGTSADDLAAVYPPATLSRLAAIKRRYDPANLFARNHNISPAPVG